MTHQEQFREWLENEHLRGRIRIHSNTIEVIAAKAAEIFGQGEGPLSIAENDSLLEIGRKAIEDALVEWRDSRMSMFTRGNGLVIREKDGSDSSIIRFGPESAL